MGSKLRDAAPAVEEVAETYRTAALTSSLHTLRAQDFQIAGVPNRKVSDIVYESGMRAGPGRVIYEEVMEGRDEDLCPMCRHSEVSELDHVLPKKAFPALCVAPDNLVGICEFCNYKKSDVTSDDARRVLLHPHFENVSTDVWLAAEVIPGTKGALRYFVDPPPHWDSVLADRVRNQFEFMEMATRYGSRAQQTLSGMRRIFDTQLEKSGATGLMAYLKELAGSHQADDLNGWAGVAYDAWAEDADFCRGSFNGTGTPTARGRHLGLRNYKITWVRNNCRHTSAVRYSAAAVGDYADLKRAEEGVTDVRIVPAK
ncbi:HNH endonuclease signature motif containing protein [Streptomyces sp. NPDC058052]|uniref:HNH endonuclease signature motif containing protein n=1 Tax=Streptomyces sp. NPDC058052 TaxID=3346316 RepID=UPI0036E43D03